MDTEDQGKPIADVHCQPPGRAAHVKWQWSSISVPADDTGPRSFKALCAQNYEGKQTTCPVLAAVVEEMAQHSCFKCFSFLGKAYGTSSHLLQWRLWVPRTLSPCRDLGLRRLVSLPGSAPSCLVGFHPSAPSLGLDLTLWGAGISLNKHALTRKLQPIPARNWASLTSIWSNVNWCSVIHLPATHLFLLQKSKEMYFLVILMLY